MVQSHTLHHRRMIKSEQRGNRTMTTSSDTTQQRRAGQDGTGDAEKDQHLQKRGKRSMPSLAEDQLNGVTPEDLTKLIELWIRQAKALGYRVRFYPSVDFDEILEEELSAEKVPNIEGVIFMGADDPDRVIYIREDIHPASQLCALIHETLHAEQPHWDEAVVHAATWVEMERIKEDPLGAVDMMSPGLPRFRKTCSRMR